MQTWQSRTAVDATGKKYTLWNTSVNKGKLNGKDVFVMAFEVRDAETPGGWNTLFATALHPAGWAISHRSLNTLHLLHFNAFHVR